MPQPNKQAAKSTLNAPLTITPESQQKIIAQMDNDWNSFPMDSMRFRMKLLDFAYAMESDETLRRTNASRIITTIYQDLQLPVLKPNIDAAHAYLVGTFLSGDPVFGVVSEGLEKTEIAKQMEAIIAENSRATSWDRQMMMWFKDALKYNIAAIECDWHVRKSFEVTTSTDTAIGNQAGAVSSSTYRAGNEMHALDMYNTAYDTSVAPADVHTHGDFVIKIEKLTLAQTKQRIDDIRAAAGELLHPESKIFNTPPRRNWHYIPSIMNSSTIHAETDWVSFFTSGPNSMQVSGHKTANYEYVTYYRRIIPSRFGISVPDSDSVQVWKFIEINGLVVFAERRSNFHNLFPTIFCQPYEDQLRHQTKGLGENLINFQKMTSTMWRARIASLARAISDRGLFDPSRVNEKDINSVLPTAKIPVKPGAYGTDISGAYYPIPYDDRNGQMLTGDIQTVMAMSERSANINKAQMGQFVKGNKTLVEYQDIMNNADAPQQAMALLIEAQSIRPIKYLIKVNVLQYQSAQSITNPLDSTKVDIKPAELRAGIIEFRLSDGLLPKDRILNFQQTMEAFQILSSIEGGNQEWDLIGMIAHSLEQRGAKLSQFRRQQQFIPQNSAQVEGGQNSSRAGVGNGESGQV